MLIYRLGTVNKNVGGGLNQFSAAPVLTLIQHLFEKKMKITCAVTFSS